MEMVDTFQLENPAYAPSAEQRLESESKSDVTDPVPHLISRSCYYSVCIWLLDLDLSMRSASLHGMRFDLRGEVSIRPRAM